MAPGGSGGVVHLHGRLFAEWLHVLMPYQCPWPSPVWQQDDRADMSLGAGYMKVGKPISWRGLNLKTIQDLILRSLPRYPTNPAIGAREVPVEGWLLGSLD